MTRGRVTAPVALALGFAAVAFIDVVATLTCRIGDPTAAEVRGLHLAYLVGYRAALAWVLALLAAALMRAMRHGLVTVGLLVGVSVVIGRGILADDLYSYTPPNQWLYGTALSLVPLGVVGTRALAGVAETRWPRFGTHWPWRTLLAVAGVGAALTNQLALPCGKAGLHLGLVVTAGVALGMAFLGARLAPATDGCRMMARIMAGIFAVLALWSVASKPPSQVAVELARNDAPGLYAFLATPTAVGDDEVDPAWMARFVADPEWLTRRDDAPPVAPSRPLVAPGEAIVVLVTIDALRHDVFFDPTHAASMPNLEALRAASTVFTAAHSTASTTAPSVASMFTGRYLSQLYWTPEPFQNGRRIRYFPVQDRTPRVPELLPETIRSLNVPTNERLQQRHALVRGMREEAETTSGEDPRAADVLPAVSDWIIRNAGGPSFSYVHVMDAHAPYDATGTDGTHFARYIREVYGVDAALGAFVDRLKRAGLWSRTVLIVAADHGEAFGEHGQVEHGGTLHEMLTQVPLLIRVPGQAARVVDQPVSLIDLGPTILDLFQQPTPGGFLGQSLLPLVGGDEITFGRPIALESSRLHRALIFRDGMKCIWRVREDQYELYDLRTDPQEVTNLIDSARSAETRMAAVRQFFRVHAHAGPGYTPPHLWP